MLQKKNKKTGYYICVEWTDSAKEWMVGGSNNKRILHYFDGNLINIETYNPIKINYYEKEGKLIWDKTHNQAVPIDAINISPEEQSLGIIELTRRIL